MKLHIKALSIPPPPPPPPPKRKNQGFNGGLFVSTAELLQLSYEVPYTGPGQFIEFTLKQKHAFRLSFMPCREHFTKDICTKTPSYQKKLSRLFCSQRFGIFDTYSAHLIVNPCKG